MFNLNYITIAKIECSLSESKLHIIIRSLILAYEIAVPNNSIEKTPIKIIKTDFVNIFYLVIC